MNISFEIPEDVKSWQVSGPHHDGSHHAWVNLETVHLPNGRSVYDANAGCYEPVEGLQSAIDKAYERAKHKQAQAIEEFNRLPPPKPPRGISSEAVKKETADLFSMLGL